MEGPVPLFRVPTEGPPVSGPTGSRVTVGPGCTESGGVETPPGHGPVPPGPPFREGVAVLGTPVLGPPGPPSQDLGEGLIGPLPPPVPALEFEKLAVVIPFIVPGSEKISLFYLRPTHTGPPLVPSLTRTRTVSLKIKTHPTPENRPGQGLQWGWGGRGK